MIKICALNEETDEDSDSEEEVTREALEQIALQQYAKALELQRKGNLPDAIQLLKDLLDTELLFDIKKPENGEKITEPLFNLKYVCYKNIASIHCSLGHKEEAIDAYCEASALDDTDVTLWYRLGLLCFQSNKYEMALQAFQRGCDCNPKHWPCIDKIVTLLLGLGLFNECIAAIYEALVLDPGYLRGLVYRKHIYTAYPYIQDFMTYLNSKYSWNSQDSESIDEIKAASLLAEAEAIKTGVAEQEELDKIPYSLPTLTLRKPISSLTWLAVGESLTHMHRYMTRQAYSHACSINLLFEKKETQEKMDVCEEQPIAQSPEGMIDENLEDDKNGENLSDNDNNYVSDKNVTDTEKVESDLEAQAPVPDKPTETKELKKGPVRRRGSALSFLEQWEWCTKRRSTRKKPTTKQDRSDESVYDTLRRMVPDCLTPEVVQRSADKAERLNTFSDTLDLFKLFEEKQDEDKKEPSDSIKCDYFGSELEDSDVTEFIAKYNATQHDIIIILKDFLNILAEKWQIKWPEKLLPTYVEANECCSSHFDVPACAGDDSIAILYYVKVNLLCEEIVLSKKLNTPAENKAMHEVNAVDAIGPLLNNNPHMFAENCLTATLRYLWLKCHCHIHNKNEEFALDCLYQLLYEFSAMGEHENTYTLCVQNFTFKHSITKSEVEAYIKFLERNKRLSTVMGLYDSGNFEEVLSIVIDSFEHCKTMARQQEAEMSLDFAVQLSLILDCFWALDKVDDCFKWSLVGLHEALKHYLLCSPGSPEHEKWSLTIIKVLSCMEHILKIEGLFCLEAVTVKDLSQGIQDLIQIIGLQVEDNGVDLPFDSVAPWIILHYILQREEDQGRCKRSQDFEKIASDEIPSPLMVLFVAHEHLGPRGWCCNSEGSLLYFMIDAVTPRLRAPALSRSLELICQYMEQCVFCLFGHPSKKTKLRYLVDHNASPHPLDWPRAQQLYEIYKPHDLPAIEGKVPLLSAETEQLLQRILALIPLECEPQKYVSGIVHFIEGKESKLPFAPVLLPFKLKDIYFLLGDYYFKKDERSKSIKYNINDLVFNNDRFESWAEIALAKATNLEVKLNSCVNMKNDMDYITEAGTAIRCFKRALEIDSMHCNLWVEYGAFVYSLHSFCSRLLKQASESLSMEDFESLEQQKEDLLDSAQKCFTTVTQDLYDSLDKTIDELWLHYYMLGKISEKRNKAPTDYLEYYMKAAKTLEENDATYPLKINYSSPQHLSIEALEVHYRLHASILKYIEQHENKTIPASEGKIFLQCISSLQNGPFSTKKLLKKDGISDTETNNPKPVDTPQTSSILKRSISDAGDDGNQEVKKAKLESSAAKVRRGASYDADNLVGKDNVCQKNINMTSKAALLASDNESVAPNGIHLETGEVETSLPKVPNQESTEGVQSIPSQNVTKASVIQSSEVNKDDSSSATSKEDSSSNSTTDSSSDDSSSDSSSDSSQNSDATIKPSYDKPSNDKPSNDKPISESDISNIISACLDALEDCVSRFPQHYKALYRLAHYHFYYKKGKDIERCRDLMLSNFTSRNHQKMQGLFSERKTNNFFNGIWRIPSEEVDRPGSFACHMSRCVLLSMEILKEIDDHKTLLDLSMHLQRVPEADKKYLRDSEREELAQQAFSLCIQSLKGQLTKFSQQADLKSNEVERKALNSLMLDIYRAYQKAQKQPNSKQFTNLLVEGFKLVSINPVNENSNLVDASMRHCQALIASLKQQATMASLAHSSANQSTQKKQLSKALEHPKSTTQTFTSKPDQKATPTSHPLVSTQEISAALQNYLPMLNDPLLSQQTAAALSYMSNLTNLSTLAGYSTALQNSLQSQFQNTLQTSFQSEYYRQFLPTGYNTGFGIQMPKKQKRNKQLTTKPMGATSVGTLIAQKNKTNSKTFGGTASAASTVAKTLNSLTPSNTVSNLAKSLSIPSSTSLSINPVLPSPLVPSIPSTFGSGAQPAHMTASSSFPAAGGTVQPAHMTTTSTVNAALHTKPPLPHQQVSPGKTLQEKLAERQKNLPSKSSSNQDIGSSISKLPSSLTVTKTSISKGTSNGQGRKDLPKKMDPKRALTFNSDVDIRAKPKNPISSSEVIVLDDD